MAEARPTLRLSAVEQIAEDGEPNVRRAFLEATENLRSGVAVGLLTERIASGDTEAAVAVLSLDTVVFEPVAAAASDVYRSAGTAAAATLPRLERPDGVTVLRRFSIYHQRAEEWMRTDARRLSESLRRQAELAARTIIAAGIADGLSARRTALAVIGQVSLRTRRREGGALGLTPQQAQYVVSARRELSSAETVPLYLERRRRDARLDPVVRRAIAEERALAAPEVDMLVGRYAHGLLQLTADTVAITATNNSLHAGQEEAMSQMIETGLMDPSRVIKTWSTMRDGRVRSTHRLMEGVAILASENFVLPRGDVMRHPGDWRLGARAGEIVHCRCHAIYEVLS